MHSETLIGLSFKVAPRPLTAANNLPMQGALMIPMTIRRFIAKATDVVTNGLLQVDMYVCYSVFIVCHAILKNIYL